MTKSRLAVALGFAVLQPFKFQGITHRPPGVANLDPEDAAPLVATGFLGEASAEDKAAAEQAAAEQAAAEQAAAEQAAAEQAAAEQAAAEKLAAGSTAHKAAVKKAAAKGGK